MSGRERRAFTLIELLVVVAIIIALLAILIPSLGKAVETANRAACASQMHQQGIALTAYASQNRGSYMTAIQPGYWPDGSQETAVLGQPAGWALIFDGKYLTDGRVMYCPSHVAGGPPWGQIWTYEGGWQNTAFSTNSKWWNTWVNYPAWPNYRNVGEYAPGLAKATVDSITDPTGDVLITENITYDLSGNPAGGRSYNHAAADGSDGPAGGNVLKRDQSVNWLHIDDASARLLHAGREWWF